MRLLLKGGMISGREAFEWAWRVRSWQSLLGATFEAWLEQVGWWLANRARTFAKPGIGAEAPARRR